MLANILLPEVGKNCRGQRLREVTYMGDNRAISAPNPKVPPRPATWFQPTKIALVTAKLADFTFYGTRLQSGGALLRKQHDLVNWCTNYREIGETDSIWLQIVAARAPRLFV